MSLLALFCWPLPPVAAQETELPLLFDARERLPRPDLSALARLRILTTVDFPPFNFADQTGRLSGFHIDLARDICAELAIEAKCQIQALAFDELEKALTEGNGEAIMAGVAITAARRETFAFSRPYLGIPARFARNLSASLAGEDPGQALAGAQTGVVAGVVAGTAHEAMFRAFFAGITPQTFETPAQMLEALKAGRLDVVFSDGLRLPFWVAGETSEKCCALFGGPYLSERFLGEGLAVMFRGEDETLAAAFDHALAALARNGRLQNIYLRYFPNGLY